MTIIIIKNYSIDAWFYVVVIIAAQKYWFVSMIYNLH